MKSAIMLSACLLLISACSPSLKNDSQASQYYWPENGDSILISADLNNNFTEQGVGVTSRHLVVKFNGESVVDGFLSDTYEGLLTGTYADQEVSVTCHMPKVSGQWREVRCVVMHAGQWAANLTF